MTFVGAAAMLEPEHTTVGAASMLAAPKKAPLLQIVFHIVFGAGGRSNIIVAGRDGKPPRDATK